MVDIISAFMSDKEYICISISDIRFCCWSLWEVWSYFNIAFYNPGFGCEIAVTLKRASVDGPIIPVMILIGVAAVGALRQLAQDLLLTTQKDAVVGILHILVKSS